MTEHRQSNRAFGLTFMGVFAFFSAIGWFVFDAIAVWAIAISASFGLTALAAPGLLLPMNRLWGLLALRIARVTNAIVLGAGYVLVILPFGLATRLFGRDPMGRKTPEDNETYWTPVVRQSSRETLVDLF